MHMIAHNNADRLTAIPVNSKLFVRSSLLP